MNILISSLGLKGEIVEEALGLFNYSAFDYYKDKSHQYKVNDIRKANQLNGHSVDEVWLLATDKQPKDINGRHINSVLEDLSMLKQNEGKFDVKYRLFVLQGVDDIHNETEANAYHNMALAVCSMARKASGDNGKIYISLACGRKTMSADLQDAAHCFGCDMMMHVLGDTTDDALPLPLGSVPGNEAVRNMCYDCNIQSGIIPFDAENSFLNKVEEVKRKTQHFYTTYYLENNDRSNFHILYTLTPSKIKELKGHKLGVDRDLLEEELEYLRRLPKTELHCHLGGVLSPKEMIDVAECYRSIIDSEKENNAEYREWLENLPSLVRNMKDAPGNWKAWYYGIANTLNVHKSLVVAPFLLSFQGKEDVLDRLIYDSYTEEVEFQQIGIKDYEALGDLQGSALLCNEQAIRKTVQILLANCKRENVKYLEVRCSPVNYIYKKLSAIKVLRAILEELDKEKDNIRTSLIIIASRHGEESKIKDSIELVHSMKGNELFARYFRGFDLAGAEEVREAKDLRDIFLEIMKDCYNITIHAGETVPSESIWQAVYYLNAERIGHGLTLNENRELQNKFLERSIGIEMCPSSNFQIRGFKDNYYPEETYSLNRYPLKEYLDMELKVSINTDDPGISRTDITGELHKAARMTEGGLSKWDILQLLCNGFNTAFYPYNEKKKLVQEAEQCIAELIEKNLL